ncbi:MAG TPA: RNA polymerase subunit sigma [Metalysinibacillus jejuensis]|uniref:RNA polymerase subunit sigma n=1 Tax=Metalysinibacillus jejuensis TaxID=914327 RepID=A0A921NCK3_9BACL|nr:RNA polymerase subunit sigma [Metalysinibacillus jejuensis]HJH11677.1 RNA polymerase subunit sigma [Metalysinibacillus jejuensis]
MSLKGVELQIAIPKTFDAGKMLDQAQQQNQVNQMNANEALKKEIERQQKIVNTSEEMDGINDEEGKQQQYEAEQRKKEQQKEAKKNTHHPFKGNFVDFSG